MTRHRLRIQQLTLIIRSTLHTTIIPNNQPQPADRHAALFRALLAGLSSPDARSGLKMARWSPCGAMCLWFFEAVD
jgi:hypothetical protein